MSHFINPATGTYRNGEVRIKKGAFIGLRTIICNSVVIGERAIVGAGSIVTKDIPPYTIYTNKGLRPRFTEEQIKEHERLLYNNSNS